MHQYVRQHICTQVHVHSLPTCNITTTVSPVVIKIPGERDQTNSSTAAIGLTAQNPIM